MIYKFSLAFVGLLLTYSNAAAQLIPDTTLGIESSSISRENLRQLIEGGAIRGENLFHSFSEFNIGEGEKVYFANPEGIQNIFSRVTGNNLSQIFGTLGINGEANLFLMNPNGIIFGQNASLDLQGSFLVTTADSILFPNGVEFSAIDPYSSPLLTIDRPIGLVLNNSNSTIKVQNSGHTIAFIISTSQQKPLSYLSLSDNRSLSIVSNNVELTGGVISIPNGIINIIAISDGNTKIDFDDRKIISTVDNNLNLGNISLANAALLEIIENKNGSINLFGKNINVDSNSIILNQDLEATPNLSSINIFTSEALRINQFAPTEGKPTSIISFNFGSIKGSSLNINSKLIEMGSFSNIGTFTIVNGDGGNVNIVSEDIKILSPQVISVFAQNPINNITNIGTSTFAVGNAGDINISSNSIFMNNGTLISSFSNSLILDKGNAGNINITAKDIVLDNVNPTFPLVRTSISSVSVRSFANSGNINIDTERLILQNDSAITTPSGNLGNSGSISIKASDFIQISGIFQGNNISSSITLIDPTVLDSIEVDANNIVQGRAGNITIATDRLIVDNRAAIEVINEGLGDSGNIEINANSLILNNSNINATTQSGQGGSISINSRDLRLTEGNISTSSSVLGNGGQISISTDSLLGLNNNTISANANAGDGGNISISTNGLFLSPETQITSDSTFGRAGQIDINILEQPFGKALEVISFEFNPSQKIIADSCFNNRNRDRLRLSGNGGIPPTPIDSKNNFLIDEEESNSNLNSIEVGEELTQTSDGRLFLMARNNPKSVENLVCH
jgi:filamentous hemagglutinin family protein